MYNLTPRSLNRESWVWNFFCRKVLVVSIFFFKGYASKLVLYSNKLRNKDRVHVSTTSNYGKLSATSRFIFQNLLQKKVKSFLADILFIENNIFLSIVNFGYKADIQIFLITPLEISIA